MQIWEAAVLGLVQGLTEFLPVSSSAHLRIAGEFLPSAADPGAAFTAIVQIGTELAVLIYFRGDIARMIKAVLMQLTRRGDYDRDDARLAWIVAVGTLPIVVLGLMFADVIETGLRNLYFTATTLIVFGIVLGLADRFGRKVDAMNAIGWRRGVAMGFAQALALIPGVSRSGATISAGLFLGLKREAAARFAFLLAIPAVFGSGFYQLAKSWDDPQRVATAPTIVATGVALLAGYFVIVGLLKLVSKASFMPFVIYRIALGTVLLVLLGTGLIAPV